MECDHCPLFSSETSLNTDLRKICYGDGTFVHFLDDDVGDNDDDGNDDVGNDDDDDSNDDDGNCTNKMKCIELYGVFQILSFLPFLHFSS